MNWFKFKRKVRSVSRQFREWRMIAKGLLSKRHPIDVHLIPVRRCNLSCSYCNEYDKFSPPVALAEMIRRVDRLASFGTTIITISGGEPLLHPDLERIIRRIRSHGIIAGLITNGYLLTVERIRALNDAGLDHLQISIDNVAPDEVSKKSLKVLDQKLQLLSQHALFHVNINSVLGTPVRTPEDALVVARRALELGLTSTVGILHDCSQQRGYPGIPLEQYSKEHLEHEYHTMKSCAPRCTVSCVQQVAMIDNWRDPQTRAAFAEPLPSLVHLQTPVRQE